MIVKELADSDGFCNPTTGQVVLLVDSDDTDALIRVLLHELVHLTRPQTPPTTVDDWYRIELETVEATATLARQLSVHDSGLKAAVKEERRSLATSYRWLGGAARVAGSSRLEIASALLAHHRATSGLLGHSERRARAEIGLQSGHRAWILDVPRSSFRRLWHKGQGDPLLVLHPFPHLEEPRDDDWDETSDDDAEWEDDLGSDEEADRLSSSEPDAITPQPVSSIPSESDELTPPLASAIASSVERDFEARERALWAIPPGHPIFGHDDDRDDDDFATQRHERSSFRFGDGWNYMMSDRRRASLLAAFLGRVLALPPLPWTRITVDDETLAIACVCVADEDDLVRALGYLQSVLLDQHVDAHAAAVWSLYTPGEDPVCDHAWYRLRVTFTGEVTADWPTTVEVWLFLWEGYPGFTVAALQRYMDGWSRATTLCSIQWPVLPLQPPSLILAEDTRLTAALRSAVGTWLDQNHAQAFAQAKQKIDAKEATSPPESA